MDENTCTNFARLIGVMSAPPIFSHASRGKSFYTFALEVSRLSGATDTINIIARSELLSAVEVCGEALRHGRAEILQQQKRRGRKARNNRVRKGNTPLQRK